MIEQNILTILNEKEDNTLTRREWVGIVLSLIGNGLLVLGHVKNKHTSHMHNPSDNTNKLIKKVAK